MEDGEVKGKTKSNRVASVQGCGACLSQLVVFEGSILDNLELITLGALSNVSIVVSNHLVEEGFCLISLSNFEAVILDNIYDGNALVIEFSFDLCLVSGKSIIEFRIFWVLLDSTDCTDSCSLGADLVFETNREEVSLFSCEIVRFATDNLLEEYNHVIKSFGLLGNSGHENVLF
jgi:hypothetical protein